LYKFVLKELLIMNEKKFKCDKCNYIFEGESYQKEFIDYTYGPCKVNFSYCPYCGSEATEYKRSSQKNVTKPQSSSCCNCSCCG